MFYKYRVPIKYRAIYKDKRIAYCKVLRVTEVNGRKVYLVDMLNIGRTNVFAEDELEKLNLWEKIKLKFM